MSRTHDIIITTNGAIQIMIMPGLLSEIILVFEKRGDT